MNKQRPITHITGTKVGTYEEALTKPPHSGRSWVSRSSAPDTPTGAAVHVNPALTPSPIWAPAPDRTPVPVINDPGLLGNQPSLADINASARADFAENGLGRRHFAVTEEKGGERPEIDDTGGITEESHQQAITEAAQARLERLDEQVQASADSAKDVAQPNVETPGPNTKPGGNAGEAKKAEPPRRETPRMPGRSDASSCGTGPAA
jgi:hypothetical protein